MKLSFVIPCYNSERTIEAVCSELIEEANKIACEYEIILVNDNSPDDLNTVLAKLASNRNIKVLEFVSNMGKHAALMAGFRHSSGDIVVCLDDDGQCPIDHLSELIKPVINGQYDVSTAKYGKKKQTRFKNFGSKMNAMVMDLMLEKPRDLQFSNFTAISSVIIQEIINYDKAFPYVNGLILRTTKRICNVAMEERSRQVGRSNFTLKKSLGLWMNGFTAFSIKPLRLAFVIGVITLICSMALFLFLIADVIFNAEFSFDKFAFDILLFTNSFLFIVGGLIGEYVGRIYISLNNSPQYVIRNKINL